MQTPVFQEPASSTKVKDFRGTTNTNFETAATAIGQRVGAHPSVVDAATLTTLTTATPLDVARTNAGEIYFLKATPPTDIANWVHLASAQDLADALADLVYETPTGAQAKADTAQTAAQAYVDIQLGLRSFKDPVRAVMTTNVSISNPGTAVFDTVTFNAGDVTSLRRILLAGQTAPAENGPYVFNGSSAALTRTTDADTSAEMRPGLLVVVTDGSPSNKDKIWELQTEAPITLGTTPLVFGLASGDTSGLATTSALTTEINRATAAEGTKANKWTITAVKTSAYSIAANEFVPVNTTSGSVTLTLPTAPADGTRAGAKLVIQASTNAVTLACGGSDVLNKAGGSTTITLSLVNQAAALEYKSGIWYVIADDLPLGQLDLRYPRTINGTAPDGTGNVQITGIYRGNYTTGAHYYINDVVNDSGVDRRVTTEITSAPSTIVLSNFASPASISPDTMMGIPSWSGGNYDANLKAGWWLPRSRLRFFNSGRTRVMHFRSRTVTDGVTTSGSNSFTSATAAFTSADVGRAIIATGVPDGTKISSVTNATTAVLSANATATATAVKTTISPDIDTSALPAQIDSDLDPLHPEGNIRLRATGFSPCTVTKTLSSTVDVSNSITRVSVRLSGSPRSGLQNCRLELSSNNFADSNYHVFVFSARNEFMVAQEDTWDVVGCGPADLLPQGTGATLTAINAVRIRFQRDSGADVYLSVGYVDVEPITNTKAKCVIWLDDGLAVDWNMVAGLMAPYGFKATLAANILQDDGMSAKQYQYLQEHFGWQVASHARKISEHTNITGDAVRQNFLNSKHAQNSFGVSGGDDFAWWGGLSNNAENLKEVKKMFRTGRGAHNRLGETLPPANPHYTHAWLAGDTEVWSTTMQAYAEKAIAQKGLAQYVYHNVATSLTNFTDMLTWLNANRASIDVVTIDEALRPWVYSA